MDIHALIRRFLQQKSVIPLPPSSARAVLAQEACIKAGMVPFMREGGFYRFCVMKPKAARPELGAPEFQLCKGTRMCCEGAAWRDIRNIQAASGTWETLSETALREAIEELGLKLAGVEALYEAGPYGFSSASTGKARDAWMFAAEMLSEENFLPLEAIADTTSERKWLELKEFKAVGRADHYAILEDIEARLRCP